MDATKNGLSSARARLTIALDAPAGWHEHPVPMLSLMRRSPAGILLALSLAGCMGDGLVHVEGQIIGSDGASIVGARVYLDDPGRRRYPASFETVTAPDGSFRLSTTVAPGHYAIPLVVEAKGFKAARLEIQTLTGNVVETRLADARSSNDSSILLK